VIQLDHGVLYSKEDCDPGRDELRPLSQDVFYFADDDDTRIAFVVEGDKVTGVRISTAGRPGEFAQQRVPDQPGKP
jgi:hypothetical protein